MISHLKRSTALLMAGLTLAGSLLLTTALAGPQGTKKPSKDAKKPDPALIAAGKKVYDANGCGVCHTINGTGGKVGPDLSKVGADPKHTPEWLKVAVLNNKQHNPNSTMPPYDDKIKGKDVTAIVAYLGSLKKEAPKKEAPKKDEPKKG